MESAFTITVPMFLPLGMGRNAESLQRHPEFPLSEQGWVWGPSGRGRRSKGKQGHQFASSVGKVKGREHRLVIESSRQRHLDQQGRLLVSRGKCPDKFQAAGGGQGGLPCVGAERYLPPLCSPGVPPAGKELSPGSSRPLGWLQRHRACRVPGMASCSLQPRTPWPVGESQDPPVWDRAADPPPPPAAALPASPELAGSFVMLLQQCSGPPAPAGEAAHPGRGVPCIPNLWLSLMCRPGSRTPD